MSVVEASDTGYPDVLPADLGRGAREYLHAYAFDSGSAGGSGTTFPPAVIISMPFGDGMGVYVALTPKLARDIAAKLVQQAATCESR